jgi:large subunit ribosomal protein L21
MAENPYAIIETGGKQYRAEKGAILLVERLVDDEGAKVNLRPLMYSGGKDVVAAGSDLEKVKVEAVVSEHVRGEKIRVFTYKAKKGSRKRKGHRQELTKLEVTEVKLLSRKPAAKTEAKPAAAKAEEKPKPAAKPRAPAKKPAAKKPATRKPAAKKPAARKPAAKKTSTTKKGS